MGLDDLSFMQYMGLCVFSLSNFPFDDCENIYTSWYYHHQIGNMNHKTLFKIRQWSNMVWKVYLAMFLLPVEIKTVDQAGVPHFFIQFVVKDIWHRTRHEMKIDMMTSWNGNIFTRNWPFVWGIHRYKGQWRGALMFSLICVWINGSVLSKQSWGWWFETPSRPLWRHWNEISCCL